MVEGKYSHKLRLIVDLSAPLAELPSLNAIIDKEKYSLTYVRVDVAINIVKQLGKDDHMRKADIANAF